MTVREHFDFVVIGSGFGGSISSMRLAEKGYRVLVLERGKRFRDADFPKTNWSIGKYLWLPALRCFGILQMSVLPGVFVLHGSGVGGGSLGYANVLVEPDDSLFEAEGWSRLGDWRRLLKPHFETAKRMLGVAPNPRLWPADRALQQVAVDLGRGETFRPTQVGVFFGEPGERVPDPYFDGEGPARRGCTHCGGCMIGCRHNAKNTLEKNYLFFAEKWGAKIRPQAQVVGVEPIEHGGYQVRYRSSTNPLARPKEVRCDRVVVAAGVLGTLDLLLKARDEHGTLRQLSDRLGENVRTNSEALLGVSASEHQSEGVAISAVMQADEVTQIEAFRYPAGSSLMYRLLGAPLSTGGPFQMLKAILQDPLDFVKSRFQPGWGDRVAGLLVMQTEDHKTSIRRGRRLLRKGLVRAAKRIPAHVPTGHEVVKRMASQLNGKPLGNLVESLFDLPITAHILGGVPMGRDASEGVIDTHCEVFGYPGLFVVDGSIVPANPGLNPSLTIAALAEYAMSHIPEKETSP